MGFEKVEQPAEGSLGVFFGCPSCGAKFSMVAKMGLGTGSQAGASGDTALTWTADARDRLEKLPSFVRPMVQSSIESYAKKHGYSAITLQVMDDAKTDSN